MNSSPHLINIMKGPPKFEVGLRPIAKENWLLPDDQIHFLTQKNELLSNNQNEVLAYYQESIPAQNELLALIKENTNYKAENSELPIIAASRLVSDDLIIMEKKNGAWELTAATLCSPTFFSAQYALGKSISLLHGPIPTGNYDLSGRISRVFDNLNENMLLERFNWTVQWSNQRFTPDGSKLREMAKIADLSQAKNMLFERVERQTIRLLPKTGAIVFTIRIRLNNLWNIIKSKDELIAFENAWKNAPQEVKDYKKWQVLERHVNHLLENCG